MTGTAGPTAVLAATFDPSAATFDLSAATFDLSVATFDPSAATFDPSAEANPLLDILAWCATAAGVAGLLTVGMLMALQLHRGEPGEHSEHFRGLYFVMLACLLASTAGPIVAFLGSLAL